MITITRFLFILLLLCNFCFAQVINSVPKKSNAPVSQPKTDKKSVFTYQDVFLLKHASGVEISPDGKWVVYVRSTGNLLTDKKKVTIWLINTETGVSNEFILVKRATQNGRPTAGGSFSRQMMKKATHSYL